MTTTSIVLIVVVAIAAIVLIAAIAWVARNKRNQHRHIEADKIRETAKEECATLDLLPGLVLFHLAAFAFQPEA